jgi:acetolactate synthase-1/2/3 large subunit
MVRQWQDMIYDGHRSYSDLSDPISEVKDVAQEGVYPDFPAIARGYRIRAERVSKFEDIGSAFSRMLADPDEPFLLDVIVEKEANVYPMIPAGATYRDIIMSDQDLERLSEESQGSNI